MKRRFIKTVCVAVALITALAFCFPCVSAQDAVGSGKFSFLNYNIAGLPSLDPSSGKADLQKLLGSKVSGDDYDIIAVQEDFGYDRDFYAGLETPYRTYGNQNAVTGDGLNIFSKTPVYDVYREGWNMKGGMLWEGDIVSQKGFMAATVMLEDGVYLDVYNLHADAFDGDESVQARHSNFTQVKDYIESHSKDRAVIITGDFNSCFHFTNGEGEDLYNIFIDSLGMTDVWTEIVNSGSYTDYSAYSGDYWGNWDSVELILYRSSEALELKPLSHKFIRYTDDEGVSVSDHASALAEFEYTAYGETARENMKPASKGFPSIINIAKVVISDLRYIFSHFDEVITLIKYANDMPYLYEHYSR